MPSKSIDDGISGGGRPLDRRQAAEAFAHALDLGVDRLVFDLDLDLADLQALVVAELAFGRTPTSIEKARSSPSAGRSPTSSLGSPIGLMPLSIRARSYHSGNESRSACSTTASRPIRWITIWGGTLPLRNPGIFISPARVDAAPATRFSTVAASTATSILTRDSGKLCDRGLHRAPRLGTTWWPLPFGLMEPGRTAVGTWSGGRFMHFGEPIDDEWLAALLRPGDGIDTVITADVYGAGEADSLLGARSRGSSAAPTRSSAPSDTTSSTASATARVAIRGSPIRGCAAPTTTPTTCAVRPKPASCASGADSFDLLLLHNPDRTGFTSEAVWDGMASLRESGLTEAIGVAPGPANGFTLDLIDCFERFGDRIDWAMVILNPLEPWPGELCLDAAAPTTSA